MSMEQRGIRGGTRIPIELPVSIRWKSPAGIERHVQAKTGNISGNGLFIVTPVRLRHDTEIQFTVLLSSEVTKVRTELRCRGRVVRQRAQGAAAGIGVVIDDYQLLPRGQRV
ncbi:MAG: PilZ domain-containing protein [Acidobacteria bacterium]|nr:PilZ domain-containing protein [Acidobacteriota bacterium]